MVKISKVGIVLILLLIGWGANGQSSFPAKWTGTYNGLMTIGYTNRPSTTVEVSLTIAEVIPDSVWTHKMVFKSKEYGTVVKDYLIKTATKGDSVNFILDEQNGIAMDLSLMDDCFYGLYTVMGNTYITTLRKLDESLLWDLFAAPTSSLQTSKTKDDQSGKEITVESMKVGLHQSVFLTKQS